MEKLKLYTRRGVLFLIYLIWVPITTFIILYYNIIVGNGDPNDEKIIFVFYKLYSVAVLGVVSYIIWGKYKINAFIISIILMIIFFNIESWVPQIKYQFELDGCLDTGDCPPHIVQNGG